MGNKGYIVTDFGQSGFGLSFVIPVLFTEALPCRLELIQDGTELPEG